MAGAKYSLADVISAAINKSIVGLFVHMPGKITAYSGTLGTVSVQPAIDRIMQDGSSESLPVIADVPIIWPRAASGSFSVELAIGDSVMLIFSQRSLDKWKKQGSGFPPADAHLFNITDAVALPGCYPLTSVITPPPKGTDIRGKTINISRDGNPTEPAVLGNKLQKNLEDLIQAVNDLVTLLGTPALIGKVTTGAGTGGDVQSSIVTTAIVAALTQVKTALPTENSQITKVE